MLKLRRHYVEEQKAKIAAAQAKAKTMRARAHNDIAKNLDKVASRVAVKPNKPLRNNRTRGVAARVYERIDREVGMCNRPSDWLKRVNHHTLVYQYRLCDTMPLYCTGALSR